MIDRINTALTAKGLLPMDGYCDCLECDRTGLNRDQMADPDEYGRSVCRECHSRIQSGYVACDECRGTTSNDRVWDCVRGAFHNNWCVRCNGDGRVFVGVPS